ncbi:MAG: PAS domain S-box protein [Candidatus Aenigmarchaeota archaeon]|nr:PAS domain S-box protein [Candidatus Aenigmarchaeota archaeon]
MKPLRKDSGSAIERRKAGNTLKSSEVRYRRLFEAAQDGIILLDFDTGIILDVNKFLIDMLGYSKEEFLNKHIWEIGVFENVNTSKKYFRELQKKDYIRYEDMPLETKEGKKIFVEFISNSYFENGKKTIQCNIRDITDRKREEMESLKDRNEELEKFTNFSVGRELKMTELKKKIAELEKK